MISPQHFQQQAAYAAWSAECIARLGLSCPWGMIDATFEPEALKLGRLQARHLHVRFSDGTLIDTDNADALPPTLSLAGESHDVMVVLALPLLRANGGNCLKPDEVAERPVRFRQRWREIRNTFGEDTRQIAVMQPELTLRFAHQNNSDYLTCPVARMQQDSQGAWALDETFLPPLLAIQGSRWLVTQLEQLMIQLRARLCRLMAMRRESNERMADFAVADVSLFWLLNALNSAEPVLGQFQRNLQSPPERLYPELARLAGSLLTFSLEHQVSAIPSWQHEQLNAVFPPLFDLLGDLLEASLPSRVVSLELEYNARLHFWQARLPVARTAHGDVWVSGLPWEQALEFADSTKYLEQVSSMTMLSDTQLRALRYHSEDRDKLHSGPSVCIFHLVGKRGRLERSPALSLMGEQPTYYKSAHRSIREAEVARLRWPYFQHLFEQRTQQQPWSFLVKAAIPYADDQNENMWFIPEVINADSFDAILINKPIYIQHMQENNRYTLSFDKITDWAIGTQNGNITANNVYQLISIS